MPRPLDTGKAGRNAGAGKQPVKIRRVKPRPVTTAPATDVQSSGGDYGMRKAHRYQNSTAGRHATRVAYAAAPAANKKLILKHATGTTGQVDRAEHARRVARSNLVNSELAQHDVLTDADRKRADDFKESAEYKRILAQALASGHHTGNGHLAFITGTAKLADKAAGKLLPVEAAIVAPTAAITTHLIGTKVPAVKKLTKLASKVAGNAGKDVVDIPAEAVPSTYKLVRDTIKSPKQGLKELAQPYEDLAKHPGRSLEDHPVGSALLFAGGEGAVGRTAGRALRAVSKGDLASTAGRESLTLPGVARHVERRYSPDVIVKQGQKLVDKGKVPATRARRALKEHGNPNDMRSTASRGRLIRRAVALDIKSATNTAHAAEHTATQAAKEALGRHATAAVSTVAQGITHADEADIRGYVEHVRQQIPDLNGDARDKAELLVSDLETALKSHDPEQTREAAERYAQVMRPLEQQAVHAGLLDQTTADVARAMPVAVRRLGATRGAVVVAKDEAAKRFKAAEREKRTAKQLVVKTDKQRSKAMADARVSLATKAPSVKAAEREVAASQKQLAQANLEHAVNRRLTPGSVAADASAERVRVARARAKEADAALASEKARTRGVAPSAADALRRAVARHENAKAAFSEANAAHRDARAVRTAINRAHAVDANGPVDLSQAVRAAETEPVFVTHNLKRAGRAPLPVDRPGIPVKEARSGEAVERGTLDASPAKLVEQAGDTARQVAQVNARERFINDWAYRDHPDEAPRNYSGARAKEMADNAARALKDKTGQAFTAMQAQDKRYVLIPSDAAKELQHFADHAGGSGKNLIKTVGANWRQNVLAFSKNRVPGDLVETVMRTAVKGASPLDYRVANRVLRAMPEDERTQLQGRVLGGGQSRTADRAATERLVSKNESSVVDAFRRLRDKPGVKQVADAYGAWTHLMLHTLSGSIEIYGQKAMLGAALRRDPLFDVRLLSTSRQAVIDAANGLRDTSAQDRFAREVQDALGKYQGFSPGVQNAITYYTPFAAWTMNAVNFLYHVMPRDHPILTSLIASASQASEQWRRDHGLVTNFLGGESGAPWVQGDIPGFRGGYLPANRLTPSGVLATDSGSPLEAFTGLLLPQFQEVFANAGGHDWTGQDLSSNPSGWRATDAAVTSFIEGQIPALNKAAQISGVRLPNQKDSTKSKPLGERIGSAINPLHASTASSSKSATKIRRTGLSGGGLGGGGLGSGGLGSGGLGG